MHDPARLARSLQVQSARVDHAGAGRTACAAVGYASVTAKGELAAAVLSVWTNASRADMAPHHLLDLLATALPGMLLGWALGRWLQRDARWCAALLGMFALGFLAFVGPESWHEASDILWHLVIRPFGLLLLFSPSLGAWLGMRWRAQTRAAA